MVQRGQKIIFQKKFREKYGKQYMFNDMPLHLITLMIRYFRPNSFDAVFEKQANNISGAGFKRKKV